MIGRAVEHISVDIDCLQHGFLVSLRNIQLIEIHTIQNGKCDQINLDVLHKCRRFTDCFLNK